jgi:uncharacterized damage-inducible protein DinB
MKILLWLSLAAVCAAPASPAGLTDGERGRALSELHASRKQFLDAIDKLTGAQWNFKPAPDVWSVAECAEHIALSEDMLFDLVTKKIMSGPAEPEKKAQVKGRDQAILTALADRTKKANAPESIQPKHTWPNRKVLTEHFKASRERLLEYVRTTQDDLRSHFAPHPAFGLMDGYQWILLIAGHSARHAAQIEEVKANPRFPK